MNTPLLAIPVSAPIPEIVKKKRVLLIDTSHAKRNVRADVLRRRGMEVDIAADMAEARAWWRPALYDLVLINMETEHGQRDRFCDHLRRATPPQRLAFLVGEPAYLSNVPNPDQEMAMVSGDDQGVGAGSVAAEEGISTQRWGILEASRRISAVRSASIARRQAMRALPPPVRDSEGRSEKSGATA